MFLHFPATQEAGWVALWDSEESPKSKNQRGTHMKCDSGRVHGAVHRSCAEITGLRGRGKGKKGSATNMQSV